ncbi:MAG: hypothetical protein LLG20_25045 [Acidobacteriales bacterium]|nr:hypothetical protein [Terriglobales bacterium]
MRIAVLTAVVPFARSRARQLAAELVSALEQRGHRALLVTLPLPAGPLTTEHVLALRTLRLPNVDRAIAIGFPACAVRHASKVVWLPGADRIPPAYGCYLREAEAVYVGAAATALRVKEECGAEAGVLVTAGVNGFDVAARGAGGRNLKIAWFTPFSSGAVARFSAAVTAELAHHADVDIWHPPEAPLQATALRAIVMPRHGDVSAPMLAAYDLAVYNLGGDEGGGGIAKAACAAPGLTILHGPVREELAERRAYAVVVHSESARQFAAAAVAAQVAVFPFEQDAFNARKYVTSLLCLARTLLPAVPVLRCVDMMAARLAEIGVEARAAGVEPMARKACGLFGGGSASSGR